MAKSKYVILATADTMSVAVNSEEMKSRGTYARLYAFFNGRYYDIENGYKCDIPKAKSLHETFRAEVEGIIPEANEVLAEMVSELKNQEQKAKDEANRLKEQAIQEAQIEAERKAREGAPRLGDRLEDILIQTLAVNSVDKITENLKPHLDHYIKETYGILPQVIRVETPKSTKEIKGAVHEEFETVLRLVEADIPVFLTGPAGSGKNVLCKQVAEALELDFYFSNAVTNEYKLTGFIDANGRFHETQFYKAFVNGGLFMLDEIDASVPEVLIILNAAIANRYFDFPTGRVEAHANFRVISAGNTFGTGADQEYTGRFQLDASSLDRFALVEIYYSPAIEMAVAKDEQSLVDFIRAYRKACEKSGIKQVVSYRSIDRISKLKLTMDLQKIIKMCLVKGLSVDDVTIIKNEMNISRTNIYFVALKSVEEQLKMAV